MPMKWCDVLPGDNGVDVFLLHGYRSKSGRMNGIGKKLNDDGFTVIDCEYIGHGNRDGNRHDLVKSMKELERVINSRKNKVVLIGHSLGGGIALSIGARNKKVKKVFAVSAPNGTKFDEKRHLAKIQLMFFERFDDDARKKMRGVMPALHGSCKASNSTKYYLVHSRTDSIVPFSEFEKNVELFCIPRSNTLVHDKISGIGMADHVMTFYDDKTVKFISRKINFNTVR